MGGEGSGRKASKPSLPKGQRDMFGRAVVAEKEPPKKQHCCAGASTSRDAPEQDGSGLEARPNNVDPPVATDGTDTPDEQNDVAIAIST